MRGVICILWSLTVLAAAPHLQAQSIYSYLDDNGVRVFTNLGAGRSPAPAAETGVGSAYSHGNYSGLVAEMASRYGLNPDLVNAIIRVESNFDPLAISSKDCRGLMQLHPDTARRFGVRDVFDPRDNIEGGLKYLSFLNDEFGANLDHVLAAYNAGEGAVRRYRGIPPYRETRHYVRKVRALVGPNASLLAAPAAGRSTTVVRVVEADGSVVLTNLPVSSAGSR